MRVTRIQINTQRSKHNLLHFQCEGEYLRLTQTQVEYVCVADYIIHETSCVFERVDVFKCVRAILSFRLRDERVAAALSCHRR